MLFRSGKIILTGFEPDIVLNAIATVIDEYKDKRQKEKDNKVNNNVRQTTFDFELLSFVLDKKQPTEYFIPNTSWRVVKLILGNTKLSNKWWGVK